MNIALPLPHLLYKHHLPFPVQAVMRLDGKRNYTVFLLTDGTQFLSSRSLGIYETIFPETFLRIHKSCIINRAFLQNFNDESRKAILTDGSEAPVSRRRWAEIKDLLADPVLPPIGRPRLSVA